MQQWEQQHEPVPWLSDFPLSERAILWAGIDRGGGRNRSQAPIWEGLSSSFPPKKTVVWKRRTEHTKRRKEWALIPSFPLGRHTHHASISSEEVAFYVLSRCDRKFSNMILSLLCCCWRCCYCCCCCLVMISSSPNLSFVFFSSDPKTG